MTHEYIITTDQKEVQYIIDNFNNRSYLSEEEKDEQFLLQTESFCLRHFLKNLTSYSYFTTDGADINQNPEEETYKIRILNILLIEFKKLTDLKNLSPCDQDLTNEELVLFQNANARSKQLIALGRRGFVEYETEIMLSQKCYKEKELLKRMKLKSTDDIVNKKLFLTDAVVLLLGFDPIYTSIEFIKQLKAEDIGFQNKLSFLEEKIAKGIQENKIPPYFNLIQLLDWIFKEPSNFQSLEISEILENFYDTENKNKQVQPRSKGRKPKIYRNQLTKILRDIQKNNPKWFIENNQKQKAEYLKVALKEKVQPNNLPSEETLKKYIRDRPSLFRINEM